MKSAEDWRYDIECAPMNGGVEPIIRQIQADARRSALEEAASLFGLGAIYPARVIFERLAQLENQEIPR